MEDVEGARRIDGGGVSRGGPAASEGSVEVGEKSVRGPGVSGSALISWRGGGMCVVGKRLGGGMVRTLCTSGAACLLRCMLFDRC